MEGKQPNDAMQACRRAARLREQGHPQRAQALLREVLAAEPAHYAANYELGMLYHDAGRSDLAAPLLERAAASRPDHFPTLVNCGTVLLEAGHPQRARECLLRAAELAPDHPHAPAMLALAYQALGEPALAGEAIARSLALDPGSADAQVTRGTLLQAAGDLAGAVACYRTAARQEPVHGEACYRLSLMALPELGAALVERMQAAWADPRTPGRDRVLLGLALGRVWEQQQDYDRAFACFRDSNALHCRAMGGPPGDPAAFFERHRRGLGRALLEHCAGHAVEDETPVFIVGMPRSGTSLVEQILASHPEVHAAGEVGHARVFVDTVEAHTGAPFPQGITTVAAAELADCARTYLQRLRRGAGGARRVTDKLPHNFLRLGLYAAVLPGASLVLVERDPLDTCLSIFQHYFDTGHAYAADLAALGRYYRCYRELMAFWETLLPGRIHHVKYEALVRDTEPQVRRLLAFCGLAFHPACLEPHRRARGVGSPSDAQVRQPIHGRAVGRWKHYAAHLQPLREALGPQPGVNPEDNGPAPGPAPA
ncbi:MAG: tetratricopeptide repeat protein [Xanthomonadales bacterium]|nr:tetratricopeptide repeat protein [Xanthomonadales bacterium]NIN59789.1 tetratricopeptide repeat protein [Xanthomonadales bacterium]NIN75164.1 tetratricopeptide repeat protein [Xanthomonadales bacterium]NIO12750.1 tetratricopeptide repeat protein [Xanthomonadales bacterium]NIP12182.1 tetratricopeptide repeat protein [Xanthomonadales bacterium]